MSRTCCWHRGMITRVQTLRRTHQHTRIFVMENFTAALRILQTWRFWFTLTARPLPPPPPPPHSSHPLVFSAFHHLWLPLLPLCLPFIQLPRSSKLSIISLSTLLFFLLAHALLPPLFTPSMSALLFKSLTFIVFFFVLSLFMCFTKTFRFSLPAWSYIICGVNILFDSDAHMKSKHLLYFTLRLLCSSLSFFFFSFK